MKKILAVDDEKHIARLIEINLQKAGYEVVTASNGKEAMDAVAADKPDLIVLDWMMPQMSGLEVLKALKVDPQTETIPVIMLTAKAADADVFKGWSSGVDCYLTKPFNPMELLTFVERILNQGEEDGSEETVYVI